MNLSDPIENLLKIQKPQIAALKKLGIFTFRDLLLYFPYRFLDFSVVKAIKDLTPGENVSIKATIKSIAGRFSFRGRMSLAEAVVSDDSGSIKVVWFNQPYLAKSLKKGDEVFLAGSPAYYNLGLQLTNPLYEKASNFPLHTARLVPLYHLNQSLYLKTFRNFVAQILPLAGQAQEILPAEILNRLNLADIASTINYSHFPKDTQQAGLAKKRLAFEEIFINQLAAQKYKLLLEQKQAHPISFDQALIKQFVESLPFKLTLEQKKASWQILQDMEKTAPMNRLLEGDVGSGKTLVALIAALQAMAGGFQVALLAPTEILARQHFSTAKKYLYNITHGHELCYIALLTNSYSIANDEETTKAKMQKLISDGVPGLFIGTHALLQKNVKFKNLALVIIDEQHRFGVEQRAKLIKTEKEVPHLLSLSATPIPRSLQLAFYGELDISQIKEKPAGRKDIATKLVTEENRGKAYEFIKKQILLGRQAFVITPLIDQSANLEKKSATAELESLKKIFPEFKIGLLHGRLKGAEKEKVMGEFLQNQLQILVSTSVVEVGVDAPNASVMLIEGAQKFGLAQLHQFRGRVGRSNNQSYCFLFAEKTNQEALNRLKEFAQTLDGFKLAELDLKQRGFGEIYGEDQWGWSFKYFDPSYTSLIEPARSEAFKLLSNGVNLENYPFLKEKIKDKVIHFE